MDVVVTNIVGMEVQLKTGISNTNSLIRQTDW